MKQSLLLLMLVLTSVAVFARKVEGFVVFHNNDTARVILKLNDTRYEKIVTEDHSGKEKTYTPADIACYGFTDKDGLHIYRSKQLKDQGLKFQEAVVDGPRAAFYTYIYKSELGDYTQKIGLTFQKGDSSYLYLNNFDKMGVIRDRLEEFYGDSSADMRLFIHKQFENKVGTLTIMSDVKAVVVEANKPKKK